MNVDVFATLSLQPDGEDDLKKRQLMELAIINGTYRDTSKPPTTQAGGQSSTSTRKSGSSRCPLATHASSVCSVYSFMFFFPFYLPPWLSVYFFALWCFFFRLRNFFFLPPPLEMATPDGLGHRSL